jgi:hypothetical protein
MSLKIRIGSARDGELSDAELAQKPGIKVRLDIRKSLDGNFIIADHPDIDVIVMPKESKVLCLAKRLNSGVVYGAQDRLLEFLKDRGVIDPTTIQGGNVYASLEGIIPQDDDLPTIKITILNIAKWLDSEKPSLDFLDYYEDEVVDDYTDPDREYSTELGQVPQSAQKGSIRPGTTRGPYGMSLYNYYGY